MTRTEKRYRVVAEDDGAITNYYRTLEQARSYRDKSNQWQQDHNDNQTHFVIEHRNADYEWTRTK